MTKEEWKSVPGLSNQYEISDRGRVISWYRYGIKLNKPEIRAMSINVRWGYWKINMRAKGKQKTWNIHSLVLTAFIGPRPEGLEGCHNDGNKLNNNLSNLRWDTRQSNSDDQLIHGTRARGERSGASIFTEKEVSEIKRRWLSGEGTVRLSKEYKCHRNTIGAMIRRISWLHIKMNNNKRKITYGKPRKLH
jgi:hypothetical protein